MTHKKSDSCEFLLEDPSLTQQPQVKRNNKKDESELADLRRFRQEQEEEERRRRIRFHTTLCLSMTTVATGISLLFLVPLYVDPAISTLTSNFIDLPVTCTTVGRYDFTGLNNCSWSSCREGCTSDMYRCTHIYVKYQDQDQDHAMKDRDGVLLVNVKGCGYPPSVRCVNFTSKYGIVGNTFPCYYSKNNKTVTLPKYDKTDQIRIIINYFVIPFVLCILTSIAICVMHCEWPFKQSKQKSNVGSVNTGSDDVQPMETDGALEFNAGHV